MSQQLEPCSFSESDLLTVWEASRQAKPSIRTLTLLRAVLQQRENGIANWTIGESDAFLLKLQRSLFGTYLKGSSICPTCAAEIEISLEVESLLTTCGCGSRTYRITYGRPPLIISFRLPTLQDLQELPVEEEATILRRLLVERCVQHVESKGRKISNKSLSEEATTAVSQAMGREDPQADIVLNLQCPECSHTWQNTFDIADFIWREISSKARRLLYEIHHLAQAYSWTESEILALSEARRQIYLDLVL